MFYQLNVLGNIFFAIEQGLRSLIGVIAGALYGYIVDLYNVFMIIARTDVLDYDYIKLIYNRVGMILGLFMLFKLSFTLIQSLVDPDKFSDKKNGFANVIVRCIIAIVLLGVTPSLFKFARNLQSVLVGSEADSNNVLYRVFMADDVVSETTAGFGQKLSSDLFFSFFREKKDVSYRGNVSVLDNDNGQAFVTETYDLIQKKVENGEMKFSEVVPYLSLRDNGKYVFEWDIILSIVAAIAVLWILVNYCISIAIRVIQLAYLQLISPIPILSYIGNPEGSFKKWIKQCSSTYLELFMRLGIIYFIITVANKALSTINSADFIANLGFSVDDGGYVLVKVFLLIGLLMFGKRVPELLKELFPGDGKFDLGIKSPKKLFGEIPGGKAAWGLGTGVAIGAAAGLGSNAIHGFMNMKKEWKDNQGRARFKKTLGAGVKGLFSSAGGALGGAKIGGVTGLNGKKMPGIKATVQQSNENRDRRQRRRDLINSGEYHGYNVPIDRVLAFAGEKTVAEKKIKAAEFRIDALQQAKSIQWQTFAQANPGSDLALLRSLQEFEEHGKKVWKGVDSSGVEQVFTYQRNATTGNYEYHNIKGGASTITGAEERIVTNSANMDKQIKDQSKIIKGLEQADKEAKSGKK